jgi:predicted nucleic acid-binding protein
MPLIVDATVTLAWCYPEESNAYADAVLERIRHSGAGAPCIWHLETANALLVGERRERLTLEQVGRFVRLLAAPPVTVDVEGATHALGRAIGLAREHRLSAYDASYLELALREGVALVTQDARLRTAAQACGVALVTLQSRPETDSSHREDGAP